MPQIVKPPIGAFSASPHSLICYRPTPFPRGQKVSPKMIRLRVWAKENNYSIAQCRRLIRDRYLLAHKFKNRWMVAENPDCPIEDSN